MITRGGSGFLSSFFSAAKVEVRRVNHTRRMNAERVCVRSADAAERPVRIPTITSENERCGWSATQPRSSNRGERHLFAGRPGGASQNISRGPARHERSPRFGPLPIVPRRGIEEKISGEFAVGISSGAPPGQQGKRRADPGAALVPRLPPANFLRCPSGTNLRAEKRAFANDARIPICSSNTDSCVKNVRDSSPRLLQDDLTRRVRGRFRLGRGFRGGVRRACKFVCAG